MLSQLKREAIYAIGSGSAAATLTAAYAGNAKAIPVSGYTQAQVMVSYTPKSGQSDRYCDLKFEVSPDSGTTYFPTSTLIENAPADGVSATIYDVHDEEYRIPDSADSAGGTSYNRIINIPLEFGFLANKYLYFKVSAKEDGSGNFGTVLVIVSLTGYY